MRNAIRRAIFAGVAGVAALAGYGMSGTMPANAATAGIVVHYRSHMLTCDRSQRGDVATVVGNGRPFHAICSQNGRIWTWNAIRTNTANLARCDKRVANVIDGLIPTGVADVSSPRHLVNFACGTDHLTRGETRRAVSYAKRYENTTAS